MLITDFFQHGSNPNIVLCEPSSIFKDSLEYSKNIKYNGLMKNGLEITIYNNSKRIQLINSINDRIVDCVTFTQDCINYGTKCELKIDQNYDLDKYLSMTIEEIFDRCKLLALYS